MRYSPTCTEPLREQSTSDYPASHEVSEVGLKIAMTRLSTETSPNTAKPNCQVRAGTPSRYAVGRPAGLCETRAVEASASDDAPTAVLACFEYDIAMSVEPTLLGAIGVAPRTSATFRGHTRELGMCPPDVARSRPGQRGALKALVEMVVFLASRAVVKADSRTDLRPRDDRVISDLIELESRVGREQHVAKTALSIAKSYECPPILDREPVECGQQRIRYGGRRRLGQRADSDRQRIDDRELTRYARPHPREGRATDRSRRMVNAEPPCRAIPPEHDIDRAYCSTRPLAWFFTPCDAPRGCPGAADPFGAEGIPSAAHHLGPYFAIQRIEGMVQPTQNAMRQGRRMGRFVDRLLVHQIVMQHLDCPGDLISCFTGNGGQIGIAVADSINEIRPGAVEQVPVIRQPHLAYPLRVK